MLTNKEALTALRLQVGEAVEIGQGTGALWIQRQDRNRWALIDINEGTTRTVDYNQLLCWEHRGDT